MLCLPGFCSGHPFMSILCRGKEIGMPFLHLAGVNVDMDSGPPTLQLQSVLVTWAQDLCQNVGSGLLQSDCCTA